MSVVSCKNVSNVTGNILKKFNSSYFITTPIFYVNALPHLGHLYTAILADASYRFNLLKDKTSDGLFSVGTDEHGTKIQQAAESRSLPPDKYCQEVTSQYRQLFKKFNIKYTDFIHTTEERHKRTVCTIWDKLVSNGLITKGSYSGWYCNADESFVASEQLMCMERDGETIKVSVESGRPVYWVQEDNYKFHMIPFKTEIRNWIKGGAIRPNKFEKLLLTWIDEGVADNHLSVSRPTTRVHWGIPVPGDSSQTIYVWLDALINYLTVSGYPMSKIWPPNNQIIGKDILKFHGIYWPALLLALDLPLPERISVHSHLLVEGEKMSKTKGNVIDPFQAAKMYTIDGLRYFLLREATPHSDINFSDDKVTRILNAELADTLGNLLSRCSANSVNKWQMYPEYDKETFDLCCLKNYPELVNSLEFLADEVSEHYSEMNFYKGIARIVSTLHEGNRMFEIAKPWELRKSASCDSQLLSLIHLTMETLRIAAICLSPVTPGLSNTLLNKLSVPENKRLWTDTMPSWKSGECHRPHQLDAGKVILYRKIGAY